MFQVFAGASLGLTATKFVAQFRLRDGVRTGGMIAFSEALGIVTGSMSALLLFLCAVPIATHFLANPPLAKLLRISSAGLLLSALNGAQQGGLMGLHAFRSMAIANLIAGMLSLPFIIIGVVSYGLEGAVWATILSLALSCVFSHYALRLRCKAESIVVAIRDYRQYWSILSSFTLPALLGASIVGPATWICNALLVNTPRGYAEMGIFNAANLWYSLLLFLPTTLGQAVLPALSETYGDRDSQNARRLTKLTVAANLLIVLPAAFVCSLLSPLIVKIYGPGFSRAWPTLILALVTAAIVAVQSPVGNVIIASGRMWSGFILNAFWGTSFVALSAIAVRWGAFGLSGARLCAYILHSIGIVWLAFRLLGTGNEPSPVLDHALLDS
jgi:O-antigen/teichoic acid export membrane protein